MVVSTETFVTLDHFIGGAHSSHLPKGSSVANEVNINYTQLTKVITKWSSLMIIFDMMIGKLGRFGLICMAMVPDVWETSRASVKDTGSGGF